MSQSDRTAQPFLEGPHRQAAPSAGIHSAETLRGVTAATRASDACAHPRARGSPRIGRQPAARAGLQAQRGVTSSAPCAGGARGSRRGGAGLSLRPPPFLHNYLEFNYAFQFVFMVVLFIS